jgi:hypothetical protein
MKRFEIHLDNDFGTHQYTQNKTKKTNNLPNVLEGVHKKRGKQHDKFPLVWSPGPLVSYSGVKWGEARRGCAQITALVVRVTKKQPNGQI